MHTIGHLRRASIVRLLSVLCAALVGAVSACAREGESATGDADPVLEFDTAQVRLVTRSDTLRLLVELASTEDQRSLGLMERRRLADSSGMLFLYPEPQPESDGFWMFRTRIPLDIAFVDSAGTIRSIHQMQPCEATMAAGCPTYKAGARFQAALEVNAGYFRRHGVSVGDRIVLGDTARRTVGRR